MLYTAEFNGVNKSGTPTSCKVDHSVWYVDAQGYGARAKLVEKYRLGGISEWEIGYGDNLAIEEVKKIAIAMGQDKVVGEVSTDVDNLLYGESIVFSGKFKLADGRPVAEVPVFMEVKRSSGSSRRPVGNTAADGTFQSKVLLGESTEISFSTDETWDRTLGQTPIKTIGVSRVISWKIPGSMKHGVTYKVTGQIQPRIAGVNVSLDDGAKVSSGITNADGTFELEVTPTKIGAKQFRIVTEAESAFSGSKSAFTTVLVR